ncbi:sterol O-acyltransferase 2 [Bacillus rossius redtenbacheri]|uniref:sterol O-acyltransferase 2 n=1 Tax=Bacillus rossius redtenbacheri TaxID=93214 RepID=UPI002FDCBE6C
MLREYSAGNNSELLENDSCRIIYRNKEMSAPPETNGEAARHAEMPLETLKKNIQALQASALEQLEASLSRVTGQFLADVGRAGLPAHDSYHSHDSHDSPKYRNRVKGGGPASEKHFAPRSSLLTDLFEVKHVRTIYNIFCAVLIAVLVHTAARELVATGTVNLEFELISWNFSKLDKGACIWSAMTLASMAVYPGFRAWAGRRASLPPGSAAQKCWDHGWLVVFLLYVALFVWLSVRFLLLWELRPALSFVVLTEQVRMLMKMYAFVRGNAPRALAFKPHADPDASPCPPFSCYLYFLFAPTLVYRDSYPRTESTDWRKVARHLLDMLGVVFYVWFIFKHCFVPTFGRFGRRPVSAETLLVWAFGAMVPATVVFLCGFYCLLHCWLNAAAEALRFADRMFYKDWWNCTSYADYFRTWNIVVHDWLHTYLYRDLRALLGARGGALPTVGVFLVSALVHEYILALTFRFLCPALLLAFAGFGTGMVFMPRDVAGGGNLLVWLMMFSGNGIIVTAYCIEWYARINCKRTLDTAWDYVVPRAWACEPLSSAA